MTVNLSIEIKVMVCSYLPIEDLNEIALLDKSWYEAVSIFSECFNIEEEIKKRFPFLKAIINESMWKQLASLDSFGLSFEALSQGFNKRKFIPIVSRLFSMQIVREEGISLLILPKGLSFAKLYALVNQVCLEQKIYSPFGEIWEMIKEIKGQEIPRTQWVLISNAPVKESKKKCVESQLIHLKKEGFGLPTFLAVTTLIALRYINDPLNPILRCKNGVRDSTYCAEQVGDKKWFTIVKGWNLQESNLGMFIYADPLPPEEPGISGSLVMYDFFTTSFERKI
jgi:hypothetical protein